MTRIVLIWGAIAGLIMVLAFYLMGLLIGDGPADTSQGMLLGYASMLLAFFTSYFGVKRAREISKNWNFWKAWGTGMLIVLFSAILYVLGWIQYSSNHPEIMDAYFESSIEKIKDQYSTEPEVMEAKIQESREWAEKYRNNSPVTWFVSYTEPLLPGILITLIIAILLRKPLSPLEEA